MGVTGVGSPKDNSIAIKKADGTVVARVNRTGSKNKKKKKLNYNYREISGQLMRTATSVGARVVMVRAFQKVGTLYRKLKSGDYSEKEVERAIAHAEQIAMVAKKRMKHLQEEERLKKGGSCETGQRRDRKAYGRTGGNAGRDRPDGADGRAGGSGDGRTGRYGSRGFEASEEKTQVERTQRDHGSRYEVFESSFLPAGKGKTGKRIRGRRERQQRQR